MTVTIKQIAEMAGVSAGTVDRVINNRGKVKPETEKRIRTVADKLGYQPNKVAKSLALRKKNLTIGVISHVQKDYQNHAVSESLRGIAEGAKEYSDFGISLMMRYCRNFDPIHQLELIDELLQENICALAIMPINDPQIRGKLDQLSSQGFPVFCFTNDIETEFPHFYVGIDTYKTGCIAAGLFNLFAPASHRLGVLISPLSLLGNLNRLNGFTETLKTRYPSNLLSCTVEVADDDIDAYQKTQKLFLSHPEITACFLASGACHGILSALKELGLLGKIPIISIDTSQPVIDALKSHTISATISQNPYQHGYQTIKSICEMLFDNRIPENHHICVESTILIPEDFL